MLRNITGVAAEITVQISIKEGFDSEKSKEISDESQMKYLTISPQKKEGTWGADLMKCHDMYCSWNQRRGRSMAGVRGEGSTQMAGAGRGAGWGSGLSLEG